MALLWTVCVLLIKNCNSDKLRFSLYFSVCPSLCLLVCDLSDILFVYFCLSYICRLSISFLFVKIVFPMNSMSVAIHFCYVQPAFKGSLNNVPGHLESEFNWSLLVRKHK